MREKRKLPYEEMDCERLQPYCDFYQEWGSPTPHHHTMCDGMFCESAYEEYLDEVEDDE